METARRYYLKKTCLFLNRIRSPRQPGPSDGKGCPTAVAADGAALPPLNGNGWPRSMKHMPTGLIVFFSIFFAIGFLILGIGLYSLRMSYLAKNWPTTEGKVTHSEVQASSDSDWTTFEAIVKYRYVVSGVIYEGDRIAFGYSGSSLRPTHQEIADRPTGVKT